MDPIQITIILVTVTLTVLIVILGIQVRYILKEFRQTVQKINKMLDDAGVVTGVMSESATGIAGFVSGIKTGISILRSITGKGMQHGG